MAHHLNGHGCHLQLAHSSRCTHSRFFENMSIPWYSSELGRVKGSAAQTRTFSISHPAPLRVSISGIATSLSAFVWWFMVLPGLIDCELEFDCGDGYTNLADFCRWNDSLGRRLQSASDICFNICCEEGALNTWVICSRRGCMIGKTERFSLVSSGALVCARNLSLVVCR